MAYALYVWDMVECMWTLSVDPRSIVYGKPAEIGIRVIPRPVHASPLVQCL